MAAKRCKKSQVVDGYEIRGVTMLKAGAFVEFSQWNGIVCHGEVMALVDWDGVKAALVRYYWDPEGEPPRRFYRLVSIEQIEETERRSHYVTAFSYDAA
jgi:hypothetical protein